MNRICGLIVVVASVQLSFASLVPLGPVPLIGQGLGNVNTVLTFSSPGISTTESGCAGAGIGGVLVTGPAACPAGFAGGNEVAINNTYSAVSLGLQNFTDLQIIFNANEPQNVVGRTITIDDLALTLWNPLNGNLLATYKIDSPYFIADAEPGVGNAGFGFMLDNAQFADANLVLAGVPGLYIGIASNASSATGGLETISIQVVPEPASMIATAIGLCGLALFSRRLRR